MCGGMIENSVIGFNFTTVSLIMILVTYFLFVIGAGVLFLCSSKYIKFMQEEKKANEKCKMSTNDGKIKECWNG